MSGCLCCRLASFLKDHNRVIVIACGHLCRLRTESCDRENGTLGRLHDSLICRLHADFERIGDILTRCCLLPCQTLGKAAEQERENHTGVAACAAEHCAGSFFCHFTDGGIIGQNAQFPAGSAHGHGHIGTGIAVRNGVDVQFVNLLAVLFDCHRRTAKCIF